MSQRKMLFAAAMMLSAVMTTAAQAQTSDRGHSELFRQLDANGDGFVVAKEIEKSKLRLFDRMLRTGDRNDDGRLTPAEFTASLTPPADPKQRVGLAGGLAGDGRAVEKLFEQLDQDRDGKLSKDEAPPRLRQSFARHDRNGDGGLDRAEIGRAFAAMAIQGARPGITPVSDTSTGKATPSDKPAAEGEKLSKADAVPIAMRMLAAADRDGDGKLSRDEAPPRLKTRFDKLDANGDGFLGRDEIIAAARKMAGN
jgi:Ca2+-binding EF-hand superfamily protein